MAWANGMRPYDAADYGRILFAPTMRRITGEWYAPLRCGGLRANGMRPYDGADYGRILFAPTIGGITGGMVLHIRPPAVQNGLKIPREGAFLAQGRINAPPNQQRAASIGVGIESIHNS